MSIAKPFTFVANTYAKASEVNADFDTVYAQVNTNISAIATNATDIDNLENNKADINGSSSQRFAVADPVSNSDAVNKQSLTKAIGNSLDFISGLTITKDSGSPDDTIIVSAGSAYDSTKAVVLTLSSSTSKQNLNQAASATYYVYIIGNSTGSSIDILISTSSTTPTLPSGYTLFRQIGSYTTDSNSKINSISYYGISPTDDKGAGRILSIVAPDWANKVSKTINTTYTAESAGWIYYSSESNVNNNGSVNIYINGEVIKSEAFAGGATGGWMKVLAQNFYVGKGDTYNVTTERGVSIYYFVPVKGGN